MTIFISALEVRDPKSRCQWGCVPPEASGEESLLGSWSFSWWSAVLGNSGSSSCFTSASVPVATWPPPVCLSSFSSSRDTSHIELRCHPNDLILTSLHLQRPYFETKSH